MDASNIWTTTTKRANNIGAYKLIMKLPKLKPNETSSSFKARVKAWERATGKKYPTRKIGVKSDEQRVLEGAVRLKGLDKKKDYSSEYEDEAKEFETQRTLKTQKKKTRQDVKDENKEASLENLGKTDFSKVKLPAQKTKLQIKDSPRKPSPEWGVKPIGKADDSNKTSAKPIGKTDEKGKPNNLTIKKKKKKMHSIEKKNREIHGDKAINKLKIRHADWKKARKEGKLKEWEKKYKRK